MAKGKKSSGKTYTSKGLVGTNKWLKKAIRKDRSRADVELGKIKAYLAGKTAYTTIPNPNPNQTNKRFIRVNLRDIHGDPKEYKYGLRKK